MKMKIAVIYGSVRHHRQGVRVAKYIVKQLNERGIDNIFVDAKEHKLPFLDNMYKEYNGDAPEEIENLHQIFDSADGFIIVSGEYNHGLPPALKNMLDHYQSEYHFKPSGLATYSAGMFGGVRAAVHLRAVTAELGMPSIPTTFPVPSVGKNFDENGNTDNEHIPGGFDRFIKEFMWYAEALKAKRDKDGKP
ncbi:MAG: NADPH-dependent FMN reductase [Ignavibacteriae bacterium HGW-Ignavibacteriae-4]|nr:MAG: NADPH-dependent FMN reductase [Ignavibacteriae bacterium HGW-Ignavibacteriae-4]